jgi:hypothetical protein
MSKIELPSAYAKGMSRMTTDWKGRAAGSL